MHTLAELNPQVGDVVVYDGLHSTMEYTVKGFKDGVWTLQEPDLEVFKVSPQFVNQVRWTLKQEKKVTVADLNLKVGDRIRSGDWTGTFVGPSPYSADNYGVVWDWGNLNYYRFDCPVDWQKLPKPEPTLASLGLKEGDPVLFGAAVVLVRNLGSEWVRFTTANGSFVEVPLNKPLKEFSRIQKLEVPK